MGVTTFENIRLTDSYGQITTLTELPVWKCDEKRWSEGPKIVLRNILLAANHPRIEFCIGEIPKRAEPNLADAQLLAPFKPPECDQPFFLDLASNSRTHGRFTFSQKPGGNKYYGEDDKDQWKRIIYGSIVHTGCKQLYYRLCAYVVVDDEHRDAQGNPQDDPVNGIHWGSGDSHGKADDNLMSFLSLGADINNPVQFRAASYLKWVGKGTIAYSPLFEEAKTPGHKSYDFVIPLSSLKGIKPDLGNYSEKILFGTVHEAEERVAKPGWQFFQWFTFETLEEDGIITQLHEKCDRLGKAFDSIQQLAEILRLDREEQKQDLADTQTPEATEGDKDVDEQYADPDGDLATGYEPPVEKIIKADKNGLLLLHPWVVSKVKERLQAQWLKLAKSAGVRFYSLMCMPDESLAHYHVVKPDGSIVGRRVFCAPDLKEGEYIVYANPMRTWEDVQLWENKHEGAFFNQTGTITAPRALLATLGRDTDGDFIQLIRSDRYPALRAAIAGFSSAPKVQKFEKWPLKGNLQEIAIKSMYDKTGIVASLLGKAQALGATGQVLEIQPGGWMSSPKEMTILEFLAQELQIAVDSLKSAMPNNDVGLKQVDEFLKSLGDACPWLKDFKDPQCYYSRPAAVNAEDGDTVSRIVRLVNSHYRQPNLKEDTSPQAYQNVLFTEHKHDEWQLQRAVEHRDRWREGYMKAIRWKEQHDGDTRLIKELAEETKASRDKILNTSKPDGTVYSPESWVTAYWVACHKAETGKAGSVFQLFLDEIVAKLQNHNPSSNALIVYAVQHGSWAAPQNRPWKGQVVHVRAYIREVGGKKYLAFEMKWDAATTQTGWHHLGNVGTQSQAYVLPGMTKTVKIYSTRFRDGVTTEVMLFAPEISEEEIKLYLPK